MSKTNDTSSDELSEDKLNAASGGWPSSVSGWGVPQGSGGGLVLGGITGESNDKQHLDWVQVL